MCFSYETFNAKQFSETQDNVLSNNVAKWYVSMQARNHGRSERWEVTLLLPGFDWENVTGVENDMIWSYRFMRHLFCGNYSFIPNGVAFVMCTHLIVLWHWFIWVSPCTRSVVVTRVHWGPPSERWCALPTARHGNQSFCEAARERVRIGPPE